MYVSYFIANVQLQNLAFNLSLTAERVLIILIFVLRIVIPTYITLKTSIKAASISIRPVENLFAR